MKSQSLISITIKGKGWFVCVLGKEMVFRRVPALVKREWNSRLRSNLKKILKYKFYFPNRRNQKDHLCRDIFGIDDNNDDFSANLL